MGGGKAFYGFTKILLIDPILKEMKKEVALENKAYNKYLEKIDQNYMIHKELEATTPKHYEVHQPYDPIIHENDFW